MTTVLALAVTLNSKSDTFDKRGEKYLQYLVPSATPVQKRF